MNFVKKLIILAVILLLAIGMWTNITRQAVSNPRDSRYKDPGDAYSEYIVRNTLINSFMGSENLRGSLIWTQGYGAGVDDFTYYPEKTRRYHSNQGLQVVPYRLVAVASGMPLVSASAPLFELFRLLNCFFLLSAVYVFFKSVLSHPSSALAATALTSVAAGPAMFGANLYWQYWIMFTPLLATPLLLLGHRAMFVGTAAICSFLYFSTRYEFATTFALMWLLPVVIAGLRSKAPVIITGLSSFGCVCVAFILTLIFHHMRVAQVESVSFWEASGFIFENLQLRVASLDQVPMPGSIEFIKNLAARLTENAFAVVDVFTLSRGLIGLSAIYLAFNSTEGRWLMGWAVITYGSWYIFGYQHIMQHFAYDAMLFSCTIGIVFTYLILRRIDNALLELRASRR